MPRLSRTAARDILQRCGIRPGADFHTLPNETVDKLLAEASAYGYRKPRNANGSRGRYFHAFVERRAARED